MTKIETLTADQRQQLDNHAQAAIDQALRTGAMTATELAAMDAGIKASYKAAGLSEPWLWIRAASPFAGALSGPIAKAYLEALPSRAQVRAQVRDQVWAQVRAQVRDTWHHYFSPYNYAGAEWVAWARAHQQIVGVALPCCNRSFQALMDHIRTQHPDYVVPVEPS